jgi:2,3-bisphosphoglycerate-dependent phosphoglycerate mutase
MSDLQCAARIILARHGEAEYEDEYLADRGGSLSALGRSQARELGQRLAGERVAGVVSSSLSRAVQTAELVAAELGADVVVREGLHEFLVGDHAGALAEAFPFDPVFEQWVAGDLEARIPGGESGVEVAQRVIAVLEDLVDTFRGETVLVVSHGGAIFTALQVLAPDPDRPIDLPHCATYLLEGDSDGWRVTA